MRFYIALLGAVMVGTSIAAPAAKSEAQKPDINVFQYALTVEHLQDKFYREGLENYTAADFATAGFDATVYQNLMEMSKHESFHVKVITDGLTAAGATPATECTYAFGVSTPKDFMMLSSVLEGVGISAYLGATAHFMNKIDLTDAASILTVEAQHNAYLRSVLGESAFPQPFVTPLDMDEVTSLTAQFTVACPSTNPNWPLKSFPLLQLDPTTPKPITTGETVKLLTPHDVFVPATNLSQIYAAFLTVALPVFVPATPVPGGFTIVIPQGINGQAYVVLTGCNKLTTDSTIDAGPAIMEVTAVRSGSALQRRGFWTGVLSSVANSLMFTAATNGFKYFWNSDASKPPPHR
ncbi:MAG: hypothetical protein M1838_000901 [Thelocarpon superellum]|nr:MAG: hypothetical protein M1838_000901 [Thelocarpon superellum]